MSNVFERGNNIDPVSTYCPIGRVLRMVFSKMTP